MNRKAFRWILIAAVSMTAASCARESEEPSGSGTMSHAGPTGHVAERPATDAVLEIVQPAQGSTVGTDVDVEISLEGATVSDLTSQDLRPDEGHLHVLLDDELISMTSGLESQILDVDPGTHLLKVEFVANDHAPFYPRVIVAVQFEVAP
jgi:hypothetical protein